MKRILGTFCCALSLCAAGAAEISGPMPPAPFSQEGQKEFPAEPLVGGIDFWNIDAMRVAKIPGKNQFPNPRFNQGLRYWGLMPYGPVTYTKSDLRRFDTVDTDRGKALVIRSDRQVNAAGLKSMPLALEPGKTYTLSLWEIGRAHV